MARVSAPFTVLDHTKTKVMLLAGVDWGMGGRGGRVRVVVVVVFCRIYELPLWMNSQFFKHCCPGEFCTLCTGFLMCTAINKDFVNHVKRYR